MENLESMYKNGFINLLQKPDLNKKSGKLSIKKTKKKFQNSI